MLHLGDVAEPGLPARDWVRVMPTLSGICGSDLAAIGGHASLYLDPPTHYSFVAGHQGVGALGDGARVVIETPLAGAGGGVRPPRGPCAERPPGRCFTTTDGSH